jgi:hypothetical protein
VFTEAVTHVSIQSTALASAVTGGQRTYLAQRGEWNLDSGRIDGGACVFWEEAVA